MSNTAQLIGPYERLILLKSVSLSGQPPVEALGALALQAVERQLNADMVIVDARQPWESAYVVVEGQVSVSEDGGRTHSAGPRETFGLFEALARVENGVEARAEADTLLLEVSATTLFSVLEDHRVMTHGTIEALANRLLSRPLWLASTMEQRIDAPLTVSPKVCRCTCACEGPIEPASA